MTRDQEEDKDIETSKRVIRDFTLRSWYYRKTGKAPIVAAGGYGTGHYAGGTGGHYTSAYTPVKTCSHKGDHIFTLTQGANVVEVYAVQSANIRILHSKSPLDLWVPLNAGGSYGTTNAFVSTAAPAAGDEERRLWASLKLIDLPTTIGFDWPDRGLPPVAPNWLWPILVKGLFSMAAKRQRPIKVAFSCVGSHGRTGTALGSILATVGMDGPSAMAAVRKHHCNECIETKGQEDYVCNIIPEMVDILEDVAITLVEKKEEVKNGKDSK